MKNTILYYFIITVSERVFIFENYVTMKSYILERIFSGRKASVKSFVDKIVKTFYERGQNL